METQKKKRGRPAIYDYAAVSALIKVLIDAEDKSAPLTDNLLNYRLITEFNMNCPPYVIYRCRTSLGLPNCSKRRTQPAEEVQ